MPAEVVDTFAVVGTPTGVATELPARYGAFDRLALSLPYTVATSTRAEMVDAARAFQRPAVRTV